MSRFLGVLLLALTACREPGPDSVSPLSASQPPRIDLSGSRSALPTVVLDDVPFVRQKPDFCGEACVEMAGRRLGHRFDQDAVFGVTGVDPALGRGAYTRELADGLRRLGFDPGDVFGTVDAADPVKGLADGFAVLHAGLTRGVPSIVCMRYDERPDTTEHFRLVVGYDAASDEVVYHEPAEDDGAFRRMSRLRFLQLWPLAYHRGRHTLIRLALEPVSVSAPKEEGERSRADYAQHVMELKSKLSTLGLERLNVRIEEPFVVLGDDAPDALERRAETVRWAVEHLEKDFFDRRPTRILDVYLFKDAASYEAGVVALTGDPPSTPYGFYSSSIGALVMNISTGGGTLVHEIVHPYVEADFPDAPAWLNEGLGSLFEQSSTRSGHIVGLPNWRLAGLKNEIKNRRLPSFQELATMSDHTFYEEDRGDNYAQARYLFLHLQEKGLLVPFYEAFRAARQKDPSGYATLVSILKEPDMAGFQKRWEEWVLTLSYP